jgi:predicted SnoaL-like aldol condensation-catalyzing enzyme
VKKQVLSRLADKLSARTPIDVADHFTPGFRLHDPNAPQIATGLDGAREMLDGIMKWAPDLKIEIVDTLEEGDRITVRWRLTGTHNGKRSEASILAIYRFEGARIAEDWGIGSRAPWP